VAAIDSTKRFNAAVRERVVPLVHHARVILAQLPTKLTIVLTVGVLLRLYRFSDPILDAHAFRQTQTASSIWLFDRFGFDPTAYRVPMFGGGHWVLEFPWYQSVAFGLTKFGFGVEAAGRLVSIAAFVVGALLLFGIARRLFASDRTALLAVVIFAVCPFLVFWYRTVMIDPLLVTLALLGLYAALRIAENWSWLWFAVLAVDLPVVILGKSNLALIFGPAAVISVIRGLRRPGAPRLAIPALVGVGILSIALYVPWLHHADDLNILSNGMTFAGMRDWFFGSRLLDAGLWTTVGERFISNLALPGIVLVCVGLVAIPRLRSGRRAELVALIVAGLVSIAVFANLNFVHDYYQLPYFVTLTLLAGLGLSTLAGAAERFAYGAGRPTVVAVLLLLAVVWGVGLFRGYYAPGSVQIASQALGREIGAHTPDQRILLLSEGADPNYPVLFYEARRIGWGVPTADEAQVARRLTEAPDVGAVVLLKGAAGVPPYLAPLAARFGFHESYSTPGTMVFRRAG
jgi:Dolichyl-phosphate-mannose-protein mannosyltransferase